jgi:hypothetical protein
VSAPCPYHSTLANGMRLYPPSHPCFTVYDDPKPPQEAPRDRADA